MRLLFLPSPTSFWYIESGIVWGASLLFLMTNSLSKHISVNLSRRNRLLLLTHQSPIYELCKSSCNTASSEFQFLGTHRSFDFVTIPWVPKSSPVINFILPSQFYILQLKQFLYFVSCLSFHHCLVAIVCVRNNDSCHLMICLLPAYISRLEHQILIVQKIFQLQTWISQRCDCHWDSKF